MKAINRINAIRQLTFYEALLKYRNTVLSDKLQETLYSLDTKLIIREIHENVPSETLGVLAKVGIRNEYVFPSSHVIKASPTLVGYYRLLLGLPQKTYYAPGTGMAKFKSMEIGGKTRASDTEIFGWCKTMSEALSFLVLEISSTLALRDLNDMQIMTLGQQIQGGRNNSIGAAAAKGVYESLVSLLSDYIVGSTPNSISIRSLSGRIFKIAFSSDPDIFIKEVSDLIEINLLAIEIKGGEDGSNVHNRAGEAEKSHLKTKAHLGYRECWTVIASANHSLEQLKSESPSTDKWFDVLAVIGQSGISWDSFKNEFRLLVDIK